MANGRVKGVAMTSIHQFIPKLTINDLYDWASVSIVKRGKSYIGYVGDIFITEQDELVAEVEGTEFYVTRVFLDKENNLSAGCSCPYYANCKHAIALILKAGQYLKNSKEFPLLTEDDDLYYELYNDDNEDDESFSEINSETTLSSYELQVHRVLVKKSHEELCDLLIEITNKHPEIRKTILESHRFNHSDTKQQIILLRKKIKELSRIEAWSNHWDKDSNIPDYTPVRTQLKALLKQDHADDVLQLGEFLWQQGYDQVQHANDEGETASEIGECMEIILQALPNTSLSPGDQLLWLINLQLNDDFSILDNAYSLFDFSRYTPADWQHVADKLINKLKAMSTLPASSNFSKRYSRRQLVGKIVDALNASGQSEKIVALLETEVEQCENYQDLVDELLSIGETEKARKWCIDGFYKTLEDSPGIASQLQKQLCEMAEKNCQYDLIAAYHAQSFFNMPSLDTYQVLQKACEKIDCWDEIRNKIINYLETGQRPDLTAKNNRKRDWPLPKPEVLYPQEQKFKTIFPDYDLLISIAIHEKRNDDVVALYLKSQQGGNNRVFSRYSHYQKDVANAVADTHPNIALTIWDQIVESLIAEVNARSYIAAIDYLRKMYVVFKENDRLKEWEKRITRIRTEHKPKKRLQQELNALVSEKVVG
ncbi:SWIM zinc finger family protein [Zooshikella ganghwensis]|uniref:SWIM zinc finger domain-containing protein n=1 Tax=Zooshikella ganghwensis TaxID=202772 RepID=A0A4P9VK01_9GAMM|nr:SWIM zinc finger family protein [Zooshikella ganghwensis]RDH42132.1 SWIM zinc finger domain-containing protein [Zooshikella ganghwensis]